MSTIIQREEILAALENIDVVGAMEQGFVQYSNGGVVVPPVGELLLDEPRREVHIKYGYIREDDFICIKVAGGFYGNSQLNLPTSQGLMLLLDQGTGQTVAVLLDEGYLTDVRTAAAGALAAKYYAPEDVKAIGIIGTGIQSKLQLQYLRTITECSEVWIWGRTSAHTEEWKRSLSDQYNVHLAESPSEVAERCNLIITTTPAEAPLLLEQDIQPGTHITAVGSDTPAKQELDAGILAKADLVIADSLPQSKNRGEIYQARKSGWIEERKIVELGQAIQQREYQRSTEDQITVVDLTGVAVQDIMIAKAVYEEIQGSMI